MKFTDKVRCLKSLINSAGSFEKLLSMLRNYLEDESCYRKYRIENKQKITEIIKKIGEELEKCKRKHKRACCYGVYVIRCINNGQSDVIYIGKGGTINNCGRYSKQGVFGRIQNVRNKKEEQVEENEEENKESEKNEEESKGSENTASKPQSKDILGKHWLSGLLEEKKCKSIEIEILCLDCYKDSQNAQDRPQLFAPGFIEALLLQYYLWENKGLPLENNQL